MRLFNELTILGIYFQSAELITSFFQKSKALLGKILRQIELVIPGGNKS
jgi:hypothetical protein